MTDQVERALVRLDELLCTLDSPESAYLVRSRVERALIVARKAESSVREEKRENVRSLISDLDRAFNSLRKRSEPFGGRWHARLEDCRGVVVDLRAALL